MKIIHTDALVLGGGLAGLRTAIGMKKRGHEVISLSLVPPKRSHSSAAQGGMQASLANSVNGIGDNEDLHFVDTIKGSDWGQINKWFECLSILPQKQLENLLHGVYRGIE